MGEYAELHIEQYINGRFGIPMPRKTPVYPKTTKAAIAGQLFHIVEVMAGMGMKTNRTPGMKLVVCDNTQDLYWVWASNEVNGIRKDVCTVLEANLPLSEALARAGRKPYGPKPVKPETNRTDI